VLTAEGVIDRKDNDDSHASGSTSSALASGALGYRAGGNVRPEPLRARRARPDPFPRASAPHVERGVGGGGAGGCLAQTPERLRHRDRGRARLEAWGAGRHLPRACARHPRRRGPRQAVALQPDLNSFG